MVFLHQHPRHHHGEDVHLLLQLHGIDVAAHDDGLFGLGSGHLGECIQQGGIQHFRPVECDVRETVYRRTVLVLEETFRPGGDSHTGEECALKAFPLGGGQRLIPLDNGNVGVSFHLGIGDHIIGYTAAQRAFLDASVYRKRRKLHLSWHNY